MFYKVVEEVLNQCGCACTFSRAKVANLGGDCCNCSMKEKKKNYKAREKGVRKYKKKETYL